MRTQVDPRLYIFCSKVRPGGLRKNQDENKNALIVLPCHVANAHRLYNGFPVSVKFVWREKLHEGALVRSFHEHGIREVVTKHTQHNLLNRFRKEEGGGGELRRQEGPN